MNELTHEKEVDFHSFCPKCVNRNVYHGDDPCNECLTEFTNHESQKPIHFKEDLFIPKNKKQARKEE